jgi:hypothetical protein
VTIAGGSRRPGPRARVATAIAVLALGTGAVITTSSFNSGRGGINRAVPLVQRPNVGLARVANVGLARVANVGLARLAEVYRYPLGCLGTRISTRTHALPPLDFASPCWRYGVYVTAIIRRSGRVWRLALEAISPSCPAVSLPPPVRAQLAVCRR